MKRSLTGKVRWCYILGVGVGCVYVDLKTVKMFLFL